MFRLANIYSVPAETWKELTLIRTGMWAFSTFGLQVLPRAGPGRITGLGCRY